MVIGLEGLDELVRALVARGYKVLGPVVRDGAIVFNEIEGVADLPAGWRDDQAPGSYRLVKTADRALFGWAVGPQCAKPEVFPSHLVIWKAKPPGYAVEEVPNGAPPVAVIGARPCDIAALRVLDRVLDGQPVGDPVYNERRHGIFLVAVECYRPARTCFCVAMGTGPGTNDGFDIALTELVTGDGAVGHDGTSPAPRYLARAGSQRGREVLATLPQRPASDRDHAERVGLLARAGSQMGRSVDTTALPELLARNLGNPRWDDVAERCLVCGNCTAVCPTCFCTNFEDTTDLEGTVERRRTWASCADLAYSYVHGGPVRSSIKSRYRQWATHKFSWWWDQFGTSGCVGCGRCITWCPARIDITEELAAIRASDGAQATAKG